MDLIIAINTCKNYYKNIKNLIVQLKNSNFPNENILIISGQEEKNEIIYDNEIKIVKVVYSGLHLTSAIYINENIESFKHINYWVLLPDTIKFGVNFFKKIEYYYNNLLKNNSIYSLGFINPRIRPSMDMGILHTNQIINLTDYLSKIKTYDVKMDNLIKLKKKLIYNENLILGCGPINIKNSTKTSTKKLNNKFIKYITNNRYHIKEKIINNGKINEVYFVLLDLYKYQRNFRGPTHKLVMEL